MTDQHEQQDGWGAVPPVASIRGTQDASGTPAVTARPARRLRRRQVVGIVAGATAVVVLLVAGVVGFSVGTATHAADRPVRAFLDDLTAGRVDAALDEVGIDPEESDVLLRQAAYAKARDKVTGYRIAATSTEGDTATVRAYLRQGGQDVAASFTLEQTGTDWGFFPVWELQAPELGSVVVDVDGPTPAAVRVDGSTARTAKDGTLSLRALPGTYAVSYAGGKWATADGGKTTVRGFGDDVSTPVRMQASLTDAGVRAAERAVDAWVDGCIASKEAAPPGCSFYAYGQDPAYTYTNQKWTLVSRPVVDVSRWTSNGWLVTTTTFGRATFTADIAGAGGTGTASAGPLNVNASGYVTGFGDDGATFRSAVGNGSSDTGS
ncbi:hypothetical protein DEI99_015880 [Curtobacterium sp. MCLR17_036]|uniref:hypothetical protein n=1 Tax=Curtobacterium sp. MCLR17_036 TaxID=2175620 RepID=UPI000DA7D083|nr:hypothetical protein [Curtobacterium sp. MCLR17_036]WIE64692.1 hypothetical protein DEI99_015880 [Curtobacterium sp. MCLR17_036]